MSLLQTPLGLADEKAYQRNGYVIVSLFNEAQYRVIKTFASTWLSRLIEGAAGVPENIDELESYHLWWELAGVDHNSLFCVANRHTTPPREVEKCLLNERLWSALEQLGCGRYQLWDEGLGWLAFRFVRPSMQDGYPPSCKAWGPAQSVISMWLPIIGFSHNETLALVAGSHHGKYECYLPSDGKFCADEKRLVNPEKLEFVRPNLNPGEAIFFHPRTIHTEDVLHSDVTRLNLEVRFGPVD